MLLVAVLTFAGMCSYAAPNVANASETLLTQRHAEAGAPMLRNYSPTEYGGAIQNWAVTQDQRGVIYIGNGEDGILEYDGIRWRRIATSNRTTVRSLAVAPDGRIYAGAVGDFGYLAPDADGRMQYTSLLHRLRPEDRDFADVWRTFVTTQGVYFSTFKRLIRVTASDVRVWNASNSFHLSFKAADAVYVREAGVGLLQLVDDELQPVRGGERFANEKIYSVLPWPASARAPGSLLIGTRTQGWFLFDGRTMRPWRTQADATLNDALLYGAIWLADGTLAAGTLQGGVLLIDPAGRLLGQIDKSTGLADDTVFDMFQDTQGGLWLGLDNGLARVDVAAPLTHFGQRSGLDGSVITMHRHAGTLYAGTTQGLYRLVSQPQQVAHFVAVPDIQGQTWAFLDWGDTLLVGNVRGVFEVQADKARLVRPSDQATFSLLRSQLNSDRVFVGMHNGIASMRMQDGRWLDEGPIPDTSNEVRTIFEEPNGELWLGTVSTGIVRLRFTDPTAHVRSAVAQRDLFGKEQGLPRSPNYVYPIANASAFATTQGIFRFDRSSNRFEPDSRFAALFSGGARQVLPLSEDVHGSVWMYTTDDDRVIREAGAAVLTPDGTYRWEPKPLRQIAGSTLASIYSDQEAVIWLGGDNGVYRYDPRVPADYDQPFTALVREVSSRSGQFVFGGAGKQPAVRQLQFAENALRFDFAAPNFGNRPIRFQVFLEGIDQDWSPWTAEAYRDYTNIHEGNYRFRVRAMNSFGTISREGGYEFEILPPWYRTWFACFCYLVTAAALFAGVTRWRSTTLSARNEELAHLVAMRTEELSGANRALQEANTALAQLSVTDSLTGLKNRRYLLEHIENDIAAVRRAQQRPKHSNEPGTNYGLLLIAVDIDHFKQVNDHYGHAAGDRVLQEFAHILQTVCRASDTAVRWGGEEFLIVARGDHDADSGAVLAERIRSLTAAHIFQLDDGKTLRRTCSVGFASYPVFPATPERFSWEDAVELADQCLYEAKRSGRNGWVGAQVIAEPPTAAQLDEDTKDLATLVQNGVVQLTRTPRFDRRATG